MNMFYQEVNLFRKLNQANDTWLHHREMLCVRMIQTFPGYVEITEYTNIVM